MSSNAKLFSKESTMDSTGIQPQLLYDSEEDYDPVVKRSLLDQPLVAEQLKKLTKRFPKAFGLKGRKNRCRQAVSTPSTTNVTPSDREPLSNRLDITMFSLNQYSGSNLYDGTIDVTDKENLEDSAAHKTSNTSISDAILYDNAELAAKMTCKVRDFLMKRQLRLNYATVRSSFFKVTDHSHEQQLRRLRDDELMDTADDFIRKAEQSRKWLNAISAMKNINQKKLNLNIPEQYPDYLRFTVRVKRANSDLVWSNYVSQTKKYVRLQLKRGNDTKGLKAPKDKERYSEEYISIWTHKFYIFVIPESSVRDVLTPIVSRLGLENRVDVKLSIGCFISHSRPKMISTPRVPIVGTELSPFDNVKQLYNDGNSTLFFNCKTVEAFWDFPNFFNTDAVQSFVV